MDDDKKYAYNKHMEDFYNKAKQKEEDLKKQQEKWAKLEELTRIIQESVITLPRSINSICSSLVALNIKYCQDKKNKKTFLGL